SCLEDAKKFTSSYHEKIIFYLVDYSLKANDNTNMDGFLFCQYIKNNLKLNTPVMMLTANPSNETTIDCLELGADDFLNKPFYNKELIIRIKKLISNNKPIENTPIANQKRVLDLTINYDEYNLLHNNINLNFTKSEFQLFIFMVEN